MFHSRIDLSQPGLPDCNSNLSTREQMVRWQIRRIGLRYAGFVLFDLAICALIISLNNDGDWWAYTNAYGRLMLLSVITLAGGALLRVLSRVTDRPIQVYADELEVTALPALARAANMDFWDMPCGPSLRYASANAVMQIVSTRLDRSVAAGLCPYSRSLLTLMLRSADPSLVAVISQWVAAARPVGGMRAMRRLERYGWVRQHPGVYRLVWRCIEALGEPGGSVASSQILLRAAAPALETALLRPCAEASISHTNTLPRAAPPVRILQWRSRCAIRNHSASTPASLLRSSGFERPDHAGGVIWAGAISDSR